MNHIPTAEEFVKQYQKGSDYFCITKGEAINKMIEFAKLYSIEFAKWCDERTLSDNYMDWEDYFEEFIKTKQ